MLLFLQNKTPNSNKNKTSLLVFSNTSMVSNVILESTFWQSAPVCLGELQMGNKLIALGFYVDF